MGKKLLLQVSYIHIFLECLQTWGTDSRATDITQICKTRLVYISLDFGPRTKAISKFHNSLSSFSAHLHKYWITFRNYDTDCRSNLYNIDYKLFLKSSSLIKGYWCVECVRTLSHMNNFFVQGNTIKFDKAIVAKNQVLIHVRQIIISPGYNIPVICSGDAVLVGIKFCVTLY